MSGHVGWLLGRAGSLGFLGLGNRDGLNDLDVRFFMSPKPCFTKGGGKAYLPGNEAIGVVMYVCLVFF